MVRFCGVGVCLMHTTVFLFAALLSNSIFIVVCTIFRIGVSVHTGDEYQKVIMGALVPLRVFVLLRIIEAAALHFLSFSFPSINPHWSSTTVRLLVLTARRFL